VIDSVVTGDNGYQIADDSSSGADSWTNSRYFSSPCVCLFLIFRSYRYFSSIWVYWI